LRLLLDTHIALWAVTDAPQLPRRALELINDRDNDIFVSAGSIWEIAIKHSQKRRRTGDIIINSAEARDYFREAGYQLLDISAEHAIAVENLPPLHSDPFDRILIAQALTEPLHLLTHDAMVAEYSDTIIEV
jgi:PIN domain nuclease of toxin-antitoxin system